jgi:hypothetical protein
VFQVVTPQALYTSVAEQLLCLPDIADVRNSDTGVGVISVARPRLMKRLFEGIGTLLYVKFRYGDF